MAAFLHLDTSSEEFDSEGESEWESSEPEDSEPESSELEDSEPEDFEVSDDVDDDARDISLQISAS